MVGAYATKVEPSAVTRVDSARMPWIVPVSFDVLGRTSAVDQALLPSGRDQNSFLSSNGRSMYAYSKPSGMAPNQFDSTIEPGRSNDTQSPVVVSTCAHTVGGP